MRPILPRPSVAITGAGGRRRSLRPSKEPSVRPIVRRIVAVTASLTLAAAGLAVTAAPASAAWDATDPNNPLATCGENAASEPWSFRSVVALDASFTVVNTVEFEVPAEQGLATYMAYGFNGNTKADASDFVNGRFLLYQGPTYGTLNLLPEGGFSYTPNRPYDNSPFPIVSTSDSFSYFYREGDTCSTVATVRFEIVDRWDRATAGADVYGDGTGPLTGFDPLRRVPASQGVLVNDKTTDGQAGPDYLRAVLTTNLTEPDSRIENRGTVDLAPDGSFQVFPSAGGKSDTVKFRYRACPVLMTQFTVGEDGCSPEQEVTINLIDAVRANDDVYDMSPSSTQLVVPAATGLLANDLQYGPADKLVYTSRAPAHGRLSIIDAAGVGAFTYTPAANFPGTDTFTYRRCVRYTTSDGVSAVTTLKCGDPATVTIRKALAPRVLGITSPEPTSGDAFVVELSDSVRGVNSNNVVVTGPAPSTAPVPVTFRCRTVEPPGPQFPFGSVLDIDCGADRGANRILITPKTPLVSPASYTVTLNPTGVDLPGYRTGLQTPTTELPLYVDSPQGLAPVIVRQPQDQLIRTAADTGFFDSAAQSYPEADSIWQVSRDGGASWLDMPAKLGSTLVLREEEVADGNLYRVRYANRFGTTVSRAAKLSVGTLPVVTWHPQDRTVIDLITPFFNMQSFAASNPAPTVQWEVSTDKGASWSDVVGQVTTTLTIVGSGFNGTLYRARFTNNAGTVWSNPAEVFVVPPFQTRPSVTSQPVDATVFFDEIATFRIGVAGQPTPTIQWQVALPGSTEFVNIAGATGPSVDLGASPTSNGSQVRAEVRNSSGKIYSAPARLIATARPVPVKPAIVTDPVGVTVDEGEFADFTTAATGSPAPALLWQTSDDGGASWTLEQWSATTSLRLGPARANQDGLLVRVLALNESGVAVSKVVTLDVVPDPSPVLSLPTGIEVNATGPDGAVVTFDATATDNDPATPAVTCTPASGSTFPIGETTVSCSAVDAMGHETTGTFVVTVIQPDTEGPTVVGDPVLDPAPNADGWNKGPVVITQAWTDAGVGVDLTACEREKFVSTTSAVTLSCTDLNGNSSTSPEIQVRIDDVAPTLSPTVPATLLLGAAAPAVAPGATDTGGSGIASSSCTAITTDTIGTRTVTCTATDKAGNSTTVERPYTVTAAVNAWVTPPTSSWLAIRGTTLTARFTLAGANGRLTSSASAALATAKVVRVALTGPRIVDGSPLTALCTWDTRLSAYSCALPIPRTLASGTRNPYTLTVQLLTAPSTWTAAPGTRNKVTLYLV
jgi:hypothetical protein